MTDMAVLYLKQLGLPLGALSTTVPGDPPPLDEAVIFHVSVPIPDPLAAPSSGAPVLHPITAAGGDLAMAAVQAEFDDPLEIFGWRVVQTQGPGTTVQHRLDRLSTGRVTVGGTTSGTELLLDVPKLGNEQDLEFRVASKDGLRPREHIVFGPTETSKTAQVPLPDRGDYVVFVEGYRPEVPVRMSAARVDVGGASGTGIKLTVPKLGDKVGLKFEVRRSDGSKLEGTLTFAGVTEVTHTASPVKKDEDIDVSVEGYPPVTVPAAP
jgi:hypothetical protein